MESKNFYYAPDHEIKKLQLSIAIVTIILCSFAIFLTVIYFIFNIKYRNFRLIKMSSPNINNIINLNCLLLYLCPIFNSIKGLNVTNDFLSNLMCQINSWLIPICSTMLYSAMLAKAWRIFKIFDTTPKMKKIVIKDLRLVVYILTMVAIDVCVLLVWQFYDTIRIKIRFLYEIQQLPNNPPVNVKHNLTNSTGIEKILKNNITLHTSTQIKLIYECNSSFNEVWITVLTIYKIILLMYGIYLSWLIRNVNVPSMNDAKYLLLSTYTIIVCGLGSMTLIQLLRDWPDVVHVFFTIGIIVSTCTTQCLLFIPKIVLWYKRRNDDNFKISLSQIFLQSSSSCYYTDKQGKSTTNHANANVLNLEDELCELLHENSQLKNFLKEKEDVIKILQEKIRIAKASLYLLNEKVEYKHEGSLHIIKTSDTSFQTNQTISSNIQQKALLTADSAINSAPSTMNRQARTSNHHDSGFDIESSMGNTIPNSESQSFDNILTPRTLNNKNNIDSDSTRLPMQIIPQSSTYKTSTNMQTQKLKNELDEVEELTTRVRDSISIDLSSTRRYSPLLYEYYRKQLELAKSIQSTYNIQCNTLFDAMTLMRKCLKDYCQSVHNPEYFAIDSFHNNSKNGGIFQTKTMQMPHLATCYESRMGLNNQLPINKSCSFNSPGLVNRQFKHILSSSTFNQGNRTDSANNTFLSSDTTSATTSTTSSPSNLSTLSTTNQLETKIAIENKQTYV